MVERNACGDFDCLKKLYDDRIAELKKKLGAKPSSGPGASP
jgi:hypothetical protein